MLWALVLTATDCCGCGEGELSCACGGSGDDTAGLDGAWPMGAAVVVAADGGVVVLLADRGAPLLPGLPRWS